MSEEMVLDDTLTLTTFATDSRSVPPGNGRVWAEVQCWCGVWTMALGGMGETLLRCRRCNNIIGVVNLQNREELS